MLVPGVHFTCKPKSFQQNAYVAARRLDRQIETYIVNEGQVHLRLTEKNADEGYTP